MTFNKILMRLDTPQSIQYKQNAAYNYYVQQQQLQQQKQQQMGGGIRQHLASPMIDRIHLQRPGCSSCGHK
jgi:hypothetical protein